MKGAFFAGLIPVFERQFLEWSRKSRRKQENIAAAECNSLLISGLTRSEHLANDLLLGNYPLTVGTVVEVDSSRNRRRIRYLASDGVPYFVWESPMPRIADKFIDIAVYIYFSEEDAEDGRAIGGTGFVVDKTFETNPNLHYLYVVTNKHVIEKSDPVIRINRKDGTMMRIPTREDQWEVHRAGDDVAVFHLDIEQWNTVQIATLPTKDFVTPQLIADEDIGIGDDTVMVGRFISHEGKQQNTPSVRFGNIAMMPKEPIIRKDNFPQGSFLVEMRSLSGYSGSAVLIYSPCAMNDMSQRRFGRKRNDFDLFKGRVDDADIMANTAPKGPYLLGIDWCHLCDTSPVTDKDGKKLQYEWKVSQNTGMAGVIPAWKIAEVLDCEVFMKDRKKEAERIAKVSSGVALDVAGKPEKFTKDDFESALRKVSKKIK
jgi:hypothetical protein